MSSSSKELVTLDYDRFPHFLESVIDYGDRACLLALRRVSSHCQEMVDARLFRDIILLTEITQASDTYTIVSPEGPLPLLGTLVPENGQYGQGADRHGDQEVHPLDPLRALRRHTRVVEYRPKFYKRHPTLPLRQQGAGRSVQHNGLPETCELSAQYNGGGGGASACGPRPAASQIARGSLDSSHTLPSGTFRCPQVGPFHAKVATDTGDADHTGNDTTKARVVHNANKVTAALTNVRVVRRLSDTYHVDTVPAPAIVDLVLITPRRGWRALPPVAVAALPTGTQKGVISVHYHLELPRLCDVRVSVAEYRPTEEVVMIFTETRRPLAPPLHRFDEIPRLGFLRPFASIAANLLDGTPRVTIVGLENVNRELVHLPLRDGTEEAFVAAAVIELRRLAEVRGTPIASGHQLRVVTRREYAAEIGEDEFALETRCASEVLDYIDPDVH